MKGRDWDIRTVNKLKIFMSIKYMLFSITVLDIRNNVYRCIGNWALRSYSGSDPGPFPTSSLSVRSFLSGSFWPYFRSGLLWLNLGGSFWPTLFYIVLFLHTG